MVSDRSASQARQRSMGSYLRKSASISPRRISGLRLRSFIRVHSRPFVVAFAAIRFRVFNFAICYLLFAILITNYEYRI
jgi:hypothetical protein